MYTRTSFTDGQMLYSYRRLQVSVQLAVLTSCVCGLQVDTTSLANWTLTVTVRDVVPLLQVGVYFIFSMPREITLPKRAIVTFSQLGLVRDQEAQQTSTPVFAPAPYCGQRLTGLSAERP